MLNVMVVSSYLQCLISYIQQNIWPFLYFIWVYIMRQTTAWWQACCCQIQLSDRVFVNVTSFYPNVTTLCSGICSRDFVCLSFVTFMQPTQPVEIFGSVSTLFRSLAIQ